MGANAVLNCRPEVPRQIPSVPVPLSSLPPVVAMQAVLSTVAVSAAAFGTKVCPLICKPPAPGSVVDPIESPPAADNCILKALPPVAHFIMPEASAMNVMLLPV